MLAAIAVAAVSHDRDGSFPFDSLARLHEAGVLSLTVPTALGGGGARLSLAAEAVTRVSAACPATALCSPCSSHGNPRSRANPIWPQELRQRIGLDAVTDGALINALRVEPELGSPLHGGPDALPNRVVAATEGLPDPHVRCGGRHCSRADVGVEATSRQALNASPAHLHCNTAAIPGGWRSPA